MPVYILTKDQERIEVIIGREDKRDRLIEAGYVWVNKPDPDRSVFSAINVASGELDDVSIYSNNNKPKARRNKPGDQEEQEAK